MRVPSWLRPFAARPSPIRKRPRPASRPRLERLEDRTTPATIIDLGTLGGNYSAAYGINNAGQVVGNASAMYDQYGHVHVFRYLGGAMQALEAPWSFPPSYAHGINAAGQVVGDTITTSDTVASLPHAFLYSDGAYGAGIWTDLGTPGGYSSAEGINDAGQVVGVFFRAGSWYDDAHAFLYSGGVMTDLGTLGGRFSNATAINAAGQVVGRSAVASGDVHGFLYSGGAKKDLGHLLPTGINATGQIVGQGSFPSGDFEVSHAILYSAGATSDLGTLGGLTSSALGINTAGQVVGWADSVSGDEHAFLYTDSAMIDLNSLLRPNSGWLLGSATAINDLGQIVGLGYINGQTHAYLLSLHTSLNPTGLNWETTGGGVDFGYQVSGGMVDQDTRVALYWSSNNQFADRIGGAVYSMDIPANTAAGRYGPFHVSADALGQPPAGAKYLLAVTDPDNILGDFDPSKSVQALAVAHSDIEMGQISIGNIPDDKSIQSRRLVTVGYTVQGANESKPFNVQVYRSKTETFHLGDVGLGPDADTYTFGGPLTVSGDDLKTGEHSLQITLPGPLAFDPDHPYVLVVADPDGKTDDPDPSNNFASTKAFDWSIEHPITYINQLNDGLVLDSGGNEISAPYLEDTGHTLRQSGCLLSNLAMALSYAGVPYGLLDLNQTLVNASGQGRVSWVGDGDLEPVVATQIAAKQGGHPEVQFHEDGFTPLTPATALANALQVKHVPVIVTVPGSRGSHYVLVTGVTPDGKDFTILDPGHRDNNSKGLIQVFGKDFGVRGYVSDPPGDWSSFVAAAAAGRAGADLLVTDSLGRRTGYDLATGQILTEIPGSAYATDGPYEIPDGGSFGEVLHSVSVFQPQVGSFTVQVIPSVSGPAELLLSGTDVTGQVTPSVIQTLALSAGTAIQIDSKYGADGRVTAPSRNTPPVAQPASLSTIEDTSVAIDLRTLAGDAETPANALTFAVGGAQHGTVALLPDGHTAAFTPAPNLGGPASFTYSVTDTGNGLAAPLTTGPVTISIIVTPVADPPAVTVSTAGGTEGVAFPTSLAVALTDTDGSETLLPIRVSGVPADVAFNQGTNLGGGVWELTPAQLTGLTMTVPDGQAAFTLTVTARSQEAANGNTATTTRPLSVQVADALPTAAVSGPAAAVACQVLTFALTANDPSPVDQAAGFAYAIDWDGDGTTDQTVAGPAGTQITHAYGAAGSYAVRVTATDKDGGTGAAASATLRVNALTAATLQQQLTPGGTVTLRAGTSQQASDVLAAANGLDPNTAPPSTVIIDLSGQALKDTTVNVPPQVTLAVSNGMFVGASQAFLVRSGQVIVRGSTFTTAANIPTILVTGGSLTLRGDAVQESTGYPQAAFLLAGGALDLGTAADPGGNTVSVNGVGVLLVDLTAGLVPAEGGTFSVNGKAVYPLTATAVTTSAAVSTLGQRVTFTAAVSPARAGAGTPTGLVTFTDAATGAFLGASLVVNGRATLTTDDLTAGAHTVTARYTGDGTFFPSAASVAQAVRYRFSGFLPPLRPGGGYALGGPLAVKFRLTDDDGGAVTRLGAVKSLQVQSIDAQGNPLAAPFDPASSDGKGLSAQGGQFVFNWKTQGLTAGRYRLLLALDDGTAWSLDLWLT